MAKSQLRRRCNMTRCKKAEKGGDGLIGAIVAADYLRRHTALMRQASRKPYLPPVFRNPDIL